VKKKGGTNRENTDCVFFLVRSRKMTAERIARVTGGNLFEIVPVTQYPRLYARCAIMAKAEREKNARPALIGKVENFDEYTDVIIGYPAWWHTCPMIILSFR